ncbi:MAG: hypothetical protein ABH865_03025 [Candidatus Omnitrophota bacterium]
MKKIIFVLCFVSVSFFTFLNSYAEGLKEFKANSGCSFQYPSDWEVNDKNQEGIALHVPNEITTVFIFFKPLDCINKNIDAYTKDWLKFTLGMEQKSQYADGTENKLIEKGETEINGYKMTWLSLIHNEKDNLRIFKIKCYIFVVNGNGFLFEYQALENDFEKYLPQVEAIMKSFQPAFTEEFKAQICAAKVTSSDGQLTEQTDRIKENPSAPDPYYMRALIYVNRGEYDKAWDDLHKAESLGVKGIDQDLLEELRAASGREK